MAVVVVVGLYKQYLLYYINTMGTDPYKEKMPNRGMGREMGKDDDDRPQDVNVQEIATDPQIPGSPTGLGTNFTHVKTTSKTAKDNDEVRRE
jgi:hypothetical protein